MNNNREIYTASVLSVTHAHHCTSECLRNSFTFNEFKGHGNEHCFRWSACERSRTEPNTAMRCMRLTRDAWDCVREISRELKETGHTLCVCTAGTLVREPLVSLCGKKQKTGVVLFSYLFASSSYQSSIITALQLLISEKTNEAKARREGFVH